MKTKQDLVDRLIEQIKTDIAQGDVTVLDEILMNCNTKLLIDSLPEEEWNDFKELKEFSSNKIDTAKHTLENEGYYCGNLWNVEDVKGKFKCTDEEAYDVLDSALQNDATMGQIWFAIEIHGRDAGLEEIEED